MRTWLAAVAAVPLVASVAAHAQHGGIELSTVTKATSTASYKLPTIPQFTSQSSFEDGMIAREDLAPNAHVGLGLAPMLGRNIHSVRIEQEPVPTRNPGVTFVLKFPR